MIFDELRRKLDDLFEETTISAPNEIAEKDLNDFVTDLDYLLLAKIRSALREFSERKIYDEESGGTLENLNDGCWIVDPLDGTSNFVCGLNFCASSIAFVENGNIRFAYVYDFYQKCSYHAISGVGAYKGENQLNLRLQANLRTPGMVAVSTGYLMQVRGPVASDFTDCKIRNLGSQALHLCYVADGKFNAAISVEAKIWDDIAAILIIREAGGFYHSVSLREYGIDGCFSKKENMFSVAAISKDYIEKFKERLVECKHKGRDDTRPDGKPKIKGKKLTSIQRNNSH